MSFACSGYGSVEPLVTGADVVRCYEVAGEAFAKDLLSYGHEALKVMARRDGILAASVRSASSSGSLATGSIGRAGLTGTRLESIRKVDSWRTGGESANTVGASRCKYPDGFCYGKLFVRSAAQDQVSRLGSWPTFGSLVRLSARKFKSLADLERFRVVEQAQGVYHVAAGGSSGHSFLDAVAAYGGKIRAQPGTLVADVLASGRTVGSDFSCRVAGKSCVGGLSVGSATSVTGGSLVPRPEPLGGGERSWKSSVGFGRVQVVLGDLRRDRESLRVTREGLLRSLSSAPVVFDSFVLEGGDWGYLSSSIRTPTLVELDWLRNLLLSAGYEFSVTSWGEWRFVRRSTTLSETLVAPEFAGVVGFRVSGTDYVAVLRGFAPVHPSQFKECSGMSIGLLKEYVKSAVAVYAVRGGSVESCRVEAVLDVIGRVEYVVGQGVCSGGHAGDVTLPVGFSRSVDDKSSVVASVRS